MPVVLRRRPQQRHAADVDHLDRPLERAVRIGHRLLERIEIHDHHVDRLDALLGELPHVLRVVAVGQNRGVNLRVKRLDAAVEQLGRAGDRLDQRNGNAGVAEGPSRAAGGDDLDAELLMQRTREVDDPRLVMNADQRPAYGRPVGHAENSPRGSWPRD